MTINEFKCVYMYCIRLAVAHIIVINRITCISTKSDYDLTYFSLPVATLVNLKSFPTPRRRMSVVKFARALVLLDTQAHKCVVFASQMSERAACLGDQRAPCPNDSVITGDYTHPS